VTAERRRPRSRYRRFERWLVGVAMAVMAFVMDKAVLRAVRRGEVPAPREPEPTDVLPTTLTSKGGEVDL
jgi:hypothetical protein